MLLKSRLYVFCPEPLVNSVVYFVQILLFITYVSTTFFIHIYIFFQFLQYSTLIRVLEIFSLPIRLFTCVCQFLACKVFFVSIVTIFIYFLQLQSLPFSCVPATLLSHLLSARFCSKASAVLFASAWHEALCVQYCTKASSVTERLMVEFIKKMFPCMLPPKIIW